ncbi:MAG: hypothetical protein R3C10_08485 [Pirellulales bacterium]
MAGTAGGRFTLFESSLQVAAIAEIDLGPTIGHELQRRLMDAGEPVMVPARLKARWWMRPGSQTDLV